MGIITKMLERAAEERKRAIEEQARRDLLAGAALTGANATPGELVAFQPGLPLNRSTYPEPTPGLPAGTPDPALEADLQTQLRDEELNRAAGKNAPEVEAMRRSLLLHDYGADENKISAARANDELARLRGVNANAADYRFQGLKRILDDPTVDPGIELNALQDKEVLKSTLIKVANKDGHAVYYRQTPNMSGGHDYAPALDKAGQPLRVPEQERQVPQNIKFIAASRFPGDPDAIKKAIDYVNQRKQGSLEESWEHGYREARRRLSRLATPQQVYDFVVQDWHIIHPGIPPLAPRPEMPGTPSAAAPAPGSPAPAAKPAAATTYRTAEEVKAAFGAGRITREQAHAELRKLGL